MVFVVATQGGEELSAMNGTGKIKVNEWQKKKTVRELTIFRGERLKACFPSSIQPPFMKVKALKFREP